ncbi:MAG: hypothetical protein RIC15_07480 [Vicingaceae bacterium]
MKQFYWVLLVLILPSWSAIAQTRDLLVCLEPTIVNQEKYEELLKLGPKSFAVDPMRVSSIDYIDSLLKLDFQSELEIVDTTFNLADSCLQFLRLGGSGGAASYYVYSRGIVKDTSGRDVIEVFFHYKSVIDPIPEGEKKLGISFYRLMGDKILNEPLIRLRTFKKTYEIPL